MRNILIAISLLFAFQANAENWLDVEMPKEKGVAQINIDSLQEQGPHQVLATWRRGHTFQSRHKLETGIVDCQELMYTLSSTKNVETEPAMIRLRGLYTMEYDYIAKTYSYERQPSPMSDSDYVYRHHYPAFDSSDGYIVQFLCMSNMNEWAQKKVHTANTFQQDLLKCKSVENASNPLCRKDEDTINTIAGATYRLNQAITKFPDISKDIKRVFFSRLYDAEKCTKQYDCMKPINNFIDGISSDLARNRENLDVYYVKNMMASIDKELEKQAAIEKFKACTIRKSIDLDDRLSSADVIATAVYDSCRPMLPTEFSTSSGFERAARPGIIAKILTIRKGKTPSQSNNRKKVT